MEIPSKIYIKDYQLRPCEIDGIADARINSTPYNTNKGELKEYVHLPAYWHDAKKEKHPEGVCGNNPVVVVGLRKGRISYRYLWEDWEDCWKDLEVLAECKTCDKALWAYLRDLVPGVKPKGL